jgi:hypothetical protein
MLGTALALAGFLSFLMVQVVFVMRDTANDIDNARETDPARAAVAASERWIGQPMKADDFDAFMQGLAGAA